MKFNVRTIHKNHPVRTTILIFVSLIVIAAGIYAYLSFVHWSHLTGNATTATTSLKSSIDEKLSAGTSVTPETIGAVITDFEAEFGSTPCESPDAYSWQTIIPAAADAKASCDTTFTAGLDTIDRLKTLMNFMNAQEVGAATIEGAINDTSETDYAANQQLWDGVNSNLPTVDVFESTRAVITDVSEAISDAYGAVAEAITNEDRSGLDSAIEDLDSAYSRLPEVHTEAAVIQTSLIENFLTAYDQL